MDIPTRMNIFTKLFHKKVYVKIGKYNIELNKNKKVFRSGCGLHPFLLSHRRQLPHLFEV